MGFWLLLPPSLRRQEVSPRTAVLTPAQPHQGTGSGELLIRLESKT